MCLVINLYPAGVDVSISAHGLWKNVIRIEKDKITKHTTFCGKYNRGYASCLKNIVHFLVV
jgi:hypothetical protein